MSNPRIAATCLQAQISTLRTLLSSSPTASYYAISVGHEALHRRDVSPAQLITYIKQVKALVKEVATEQGGTNRRLAAIPVTTVDVPWELSKDVVAELDIVAVNLHPFYLGPIDTKQSS